MGLLNFCNDHLPAERTKIARSNAAGRARSSSSGGKAPLSEVVNPPPPAPAGAQSAPPPKNKTLDVVDLTGDGDEADDAFEVARSTLAGQVITSKRSSTEAALKQGSVVGARRRF